MIIYLLSNFLTFGCFITLQTRPFAEKKRRPLSFGEKKRGPKPKIRTSSNGSYGQVISVGINDVGIHLTCISMCVDYNSSIKLDKLFFR